MFTAVPHVRTIETYGVGKTSSRFSQHKKLIFTPVLSLGMPVTYSHENLVGFLFFLFFLNFFFSVILGTNF